MCPGSSCGHHDSGSLGMQKLCISLVPIFNHLQPDEMREIAAAARTERYERHEQIYGAGDDSVQLFIVHRGKVKLYRLSDTGKEQLIRILEPGDFMGELALFSEKIHEGYAVAMEKTELCTIQRKDLRALLMKYPAISYKIIEEFSRRLEQTEKQMSRLVLEDTEKRIASYLVEWAQSAAGNNADMMLPAAKKDLASYLGTAPETLSRKLAEFEERGWIEQHGQRGITILDRKALEELQAWQPVK